MNTLDSLKTKFPVGDLGHLLDDVEIPVLTGPQAQGDVSWYPTRPGQVAGLIPIPTEGLVILEGRNGHPHTLFAIGGCFFAPNTDRRAVSLGTAVIEKDATLIVGHNEHGYSAVGAGQYLFNGAREQASEIRRLSD